MIPYFIFNGVNSKERGVIVNKLPSISKPERSFEEIDVPGRNGNLYIDNKCYNSFQYEITCTLMPSSNIRTIAQWLNGSGKLTISTELDKFYNVIIKNQIDFEQVYRVCNEFKIKFEVQPIAYSKKEKELTLTNNTQIIIKESTYEIKPYLKIRGSGNITLTINNKSIVLKNIQGYIELDCELEEAFKENENCNNKVECDEFPILIPGQNSISWIGTVSFVQIKYREAFI
jgi:predicted phage tail component-like protein